MVQQTTYAIRFWDTIDAMRKAVFTDEDLALLERIKSDERFEERLARI